VKKYVIEFGKESVYAFRTAKSNDGRYAWEPPAVLTEEGGTFLGVPVTVTVVSEEEPVKKEEPVYLGPTERPKPKLSPLNALRRLDRYFAGADAEDVSEAVEVLWEYVTTNAMP